MLQMYLHKAPSTCLVPDYSGMINQIIVDEHKKPSRLEKAFLFRMIEIDNR